MRTLTNPQQITANCSRSLEAIPVTLLSAATAQAQRLSLSIFQPTVAETTNYSTLPPQSPKALLLC